MSRVSTFSNSALLAEIRLGAQLVRGKAERLNVPGRDPQVSLFAGAEGARGDDDEGLRFHDDNPLASLGCPGFDGNLLEPFDGVGQVPFLDFVNQGR